MTAPLPIGVGGLPVDMTTVDNTYSLHSYGSTPLLPMRNLTVLSDDELSMVSRLRSHIESKRFTLQMHDSYYRGTARIQDLGISIPPSMRTLHVALGWPRLCVDVLDARLDVEGFRYPDSTDADDDLQDLWLANSMESESQLAHMDALIFGAGFVGVGSGPDHPIITVESPVDIGVEWDARTRTMLAALRLYDYEGSHQATLYTPDQTISLLQTQGGWEVEDRDMHGLGVCPIVRLPNRPRSHDRDGASEITPEVMSITDQASRTLMGLAVAGEFYSAPQRYILGADESAFQAPDGTAKTAWETYIGRVLALERDADGQVPTVGQFQSYDPSVFTKVIDMHAQRMSALTSLPAHMLGMTPSANPTSADAIRSSESQLVLKADRKCRMFGSAWREVMKLALLIRDGQLPANADKIAAVWAPTATPVIAATTDAMFKQVSMGYMPAQSDVLGERLGYTTLERERIESDRQADQGAAFLAEVAHSLLGKDARVDKALGADVTATGPGPVAAPPASGS